MSQDPNEPKRKYDFYLDLDFKTPEDFDALYIPVPQEVADAWQGVVTSVLHAMLGLSEIMHPVFLYIRQAVEIAGERLVQEWGEAMGPAVFRLVKISRVFYRLTHWNGRHLRHFERKREREKFQAELRARRRAGRGFERKERTQ